MHASHTQFVRTMLVGRILLLASFLAFSVAASAGTLGKSWYQYDRVTMSGQEQFAEFGSAIAMSGEWAVISARRDDNGPSDVGRLEFWQRVPSQGTWVRRDIVYPPGATDTDLLGEFVDIDGDFAVATAKGLDWFDAEFAGAAIVLQRSGTSWALDGQLVDPDGVLEFNSYSHDVAISGNTVVVGYTSAPSGGVQRGKVDIFVRGASTWTPVQTINGTVDGLRIPDDLDIDGDTLVFGASRANSFLGEVYVYERSGDTFSLAQTLVPQGPTSGVFGIELALDGERLVVLAADYVEVFERVGGTWTPLQSIHVPGIELGAGIFGEHVALSGDRFHVIVDGTGDVLSFLFDGNQFQPEPVIATPTIAHSIASTNGDRLMVGHPAENGSRGVVDILGYALNTETGVSVSPSPSIGGSSATISVTVNSDSFTPTGRVFIERIGGGFLCTIAPLLGGAGSCNSAIGGPGSYELVAHYDPDLGFAASESPPFMHTVLPIPTTTAITADSPDPSPGGTPIVVNYTVTSPEEEHGEVPDGDPPPVPTGSVTVSDGIDSCVGTVADGQCAIVLTTLGSRELIASYEGDSMFAASNSAPEPHTVAVAANLALDKRQCNSRTRPEWTHRFLLQVTNDGPSTAEAVELVDVLPADMAFVQSSPPCAESGGTVTCMVGDLVSGQTSEVTIEVLVSTDPAPTMINSASVSSTTDDPNPGNNSDATVTERFDQLISTSSFEFCGSIPIP